MSVPRRSMTIAAVLASIATASVIAVVVTARDNTVPPAQIVAPAPTQPPAAEVPAPEPGAEAAMAPPTPKKVARVPVFKAAIAPAVPKTKRQLAAEGEPGLVKVTPSKETPREIGTKQVRLLRGSYESAIAALGLEGEKKEAVLQILDETTSKLNEVYDDYARTGTFPREKSRLARKAEDDRLRELLGAQGYGHWLDAVMPAAAGSSSQRQE
jgi:hypothetical protein